MFTGLVEGTAEVRSVDAREGARRIVCGLGEMAGDVTRGDSVALDGVCLTATDVLDGDGGAVAFDVMTQTLDLTTLGEREPGDEVNVERPLRPTDRLGGHVVQGHVDGVGTVEEARTEPGQTWVEVRVPPDLTEEMVGRGSVALDGVSLTVAELEGDRLAVALVPETLERTTLGEKTAGDRVNVETDVLGKHVARLVRVYLEERG